MIVDDVIEMSLWSYIWRWMLDECEQTDNPVIEMWFNAVILWSKWMNRLSH